MSFEIHIYKGHSETCKPDLSVHFGPDWWLEEDKNGYSASYRIVSQYTYKGGRALCVKRMPKDWIGDYYLGVQEAGYPNRIIHKNLHEVPSCIAEWQLFCN